ncbi:uncharacterized protein LOC104902544 isoform X2 [Beta vulgaris subsp. vulgaris]|uniref:uncharacterized protein LOC104902544 isoform X2 n=1 Tax=Beta vulgaris subsp. vulgaris TaxID=3555 RepID=UPI0020366CAE|nr:uncharacterized protein LOC104902544 isoform X2 [Beta vulgaris subsp. vulgaris]
MASLSGVQRPLFTAAAVAVASVTTDLPNKLTNSKQTEPSVASESLASRSHDSASSSEISWVSNISVSKLARLSFVSRIRVPVPNINYDRMPKSSCGFVRNAVASSHAFVNLYQSAELAKASKPKSYSYSSPSVPSEDLYRWHLPEPMTVDVAGKSSCSSAKSRTVVVLLGWLGAKQKHLTKYAEWYTSKGFHVITFTFPMSEVLSYQIGGKAEQDVELLVDHLADWLEEEHGKNLVFHTFSNTGWLTYGVALEKFQKQDPSLVGRIKGCVVDSAPVAAPDPQVWASGFSAAFLKKQSVATKGLSTSCDSAEGSVVARTVIEPKPAVTETALLVLLENFFKVVLNIPPVNRWNVALPRVEDSS